MAACWPWQWVVFTCQQSNGVNMQCRSDHCQTFSGKALFKALIKHTIVLCLNGVSKFSKSGLICTSSCWNSSYIDTFKKISIEVSSHRQRKCLSEKKLFNWCSLCTRAHTFKSWWYQNTQVHQSLCVLQAQRGPPLRQASPRRALCIFKQHAWFTAFHHVLFEYCQNFHYNMTGFTMQMQVRCFLKALRPWILCFCQSSSENGCWIKMLLQALVNRALDVFMSLRPSRGARKWL